jgi:hypothetical protein
MVCVVPYKQHGFVWLLTSRRGATKRHATDITFYKSIY